MKLSSIMVSCSIGFALLIVSSCSTATPTKETKLNETSQRAYLGVLYMEVQEGVMISEVYQDSPAEKAGLRAYDLIVSANGHPVIGPYTLRDRVLSLSPGNLVEIEVISRDGGRSLKKVILEPMPKRFLDIKEQLNQKSSNENF
ncbi:MAG: PDZ domain-containing protein [Leptonema sp. (in: Bacteria)]|nr:PDZ domain-containing protein [Leptonema sp. (in: bacteria)]